MRTLMTRGRVLLVLAAATLTVAAAGAQGSSPWRPSFASPAALSAWTLDGNGTWQIQNGLLALTKAGTPEGPIRRPAALIILKTPSLTNVTVEAQLRCTAAEDVLRRDMQIVFGYESPTRFYYVHLSGFSDDVHNGVFLVNGADRKRIDGGKTPPVLKDQQWHAFRLERNGVSGAIRVFADGASSPAFDLTDTTIRAGRVGFGSFDDTGEIRGVVVTERK